jgi:hypothetical protein
MPATPKLGSIRYGSYTLGAHLQVRLEKVHTTGKEGIFEKIPADI